MSAVNMVFLLSLFIVSVKAYDQLVKFGTTEVALNEALPGYNASKAIDGNITQHISYCSHTNELSTITEAWLRIDLKETYSLKSVKFWYREDEPGTRRLPGYSIRVSNDSNVPPPWSICYQDTGNNFLDSILQNDCERTAQYVWIYQNNTFIGPCPVLEICEVQVFGCDTGKYGSNCNKSCEHCHNINHCGIVSGKCDTSGCANKNFSPPYCQECIPGLYGQHCSKQCSEFCQLKACDRNTGYCLHGCEKGYNGSLCNHSCPLGTYDYACREICGECYQRQSCNHMNGNCADGCKEGFKGELCKMPCSDGEFGKDCTHDCSGNCLNGAVCDKYKGTCESCSIGYEGPRCDKACIYGRYGLKCSLKCGHCIDSTNCNHVNGTCTQGCAPGWQKLDKCVIPCLNGTYGKGCIYNCTAICPNGDFCNRIDGSCPEGPMERQNEDNSQISIIAGSISTVVIVALVTIGFKIIMYRRRENKHSRQVIEEDYVYQLPEIVDDENAYEELDAAEENCIKQFATPSSTPISLESPIIQRNEPDASAKSQEFDKQNNCFHSSTKLHCEVKCPTKVVMIPDLKSKILDLEEHFNEGFIKEFECISTENLEKSSRIGKLRENITKNRCAKILPYDHSRVILQSSVSEYINASFIKNINGDTSYIASQAPMPNTYSEFWQMVWQEDVCVIALVLTIEEDTREKSKQYWPDNSTMNQGIFAIQLKSEKTYSHYTVRTFLLTNKTSRENRQIIHLQFTAWPDGGTPYPVDLLMYYRHMTRAMEKYPENKLLVHCRSGIGPTAVIIALDALYKHGLKTGMVNIMDFVSKMREDRMNMIEGLNQYICLYHVLYECFRANTGILSREQFLKDFTLQNIGDQFNILSAIKPNGVDRQRDPNVDKCTEYQNTIMQEKTNHSQSPAEEGAVLSCSTVVLSSFTKRNCIIAGRYPNHGEAVDLIRLLIDQKCSILVSINPLFDVPYSEEWFSASVQTKNIQVEVIPVAKMSEHIALSTLRAKEFAAHHWHQTTVYELTSWKYSDITPCDFDPMLDVIKSVELDKRVDINKKLVVLSRDGATGCGVFCAVYNAIQQLQQDEEVDMFTIVRLLQSRRPEMISDLSEYLCCYNALKHYIKGTERSRQFRT
uniref:protein-tyrosine-phosphatase n=1 Tax=Crassostrea virginica TaxID=6565 RepID=A0A8B8C6Y2_CRAVI|nr:receptor-type tyrosine-protein phosphatase mu-like isoform X2 [Crassostrea virginica]